MSDHIWDFVGHEQILVGQWPTKNSYLQPWNSDQRFMLTTFMDVELYAFFFLTSLDEMNSLL